MSRKSLLQRSQSFDVRSRPFSHKRLERPRDEATPVQNKRHRPECMADLPSFCVAPVQEVSFGDKDITRVKISDFTRDKWHQAFSMILSPVSLPSLDKHRGHFG